MKYPSPKELFLLDKDTVLWWQSVVDDPRFQTLRMLAELHAVRRLPDTTNPNTMLANDARRQGISEGIRTIASFADRGAVEKPFELPPTLHAPDRPVPPISR